MLFKTITQKESVLSKSIFSSKFQKHIQKHYSVQRQSQIPQILSTARAKTQKTKQGHFLPHQNGILGGVFLAPPQNDSPFLNSEISSALPPLGVVSLQYTRGRQPSQVSKFFALPPFSPFSPSVSFLPSTLFLPLPLSHYSHFPFIILSPSISLSPFYLSQIPLLAFYLIDPTIPFISLTQTKISLFPSFGFGIIIQGHITRHVSPSSEKEISLP
jgi:hypothetical protein